MNNATADEVALWKAVGSQQDIPDWFLSGGGTWEGVRNMRARGLTTNEIVDTARGHHKVPEEKSRRWLNKLRELLE